MSVKSIDAFIAYLEKEKNSSHNTLEAYRRDLNSYYEFLKANDCVYIASADSKKIQQYVQYLDKQKKSSSTVARAIASIRRYYQFLLENNLISSNPAKNIIYKTVFRSNPEILSLDEVEKLLIQPNISTNKGRRDKAILEVMYATGIKVNEILSLKVSDINDSMKTIFINRGKTGERMVPIYGEAMKCIDNYIKTVRSSIIDEDTDILFLNLNGAPMTRQGLWKIIKQYAEQAQIKKDITPQIIRNSFAAHLLQNGADVKTVKELLGHSDIVSTRYYTKIVVNKYKDKYTKYHPKAK